MQLRCWEAWWHPGAHSFVWDLFFPLWKSSGLSFLFPIFWNFMLMWLLISLRRCSWCGCFVVVVTEVGISFQWILSVRRFMSFSNGKFSRMFLFVIPRCPLSPVAVSWTSVFLDAKPLWCSIGPLIFFSLLAFHFFCLICFQEMSLTLLSNLLNYYISYHALTSKSSFSLSELPVVAVL